jgi:heptosyltransferase-2
MVIPSPLSPLSSPLSTRAKLASPDGFSLVIQTSFLGDVILTTPLLAALARRGPVDVVTTPAAAAILANHPAVHSVIPYDKRGDAAGLPGLWRLARTLRKRYLARDQDSIAGGNGDTGLPVAYLAQGSMRSASLALLIGCDERVGFETSAARALYTRSVAYDPHRHHAERLWQLGAGERAEDPPDEARQLRLYPGADDVRAVDRLLEQARYAGEPLVALAPGSAWATKRWPYYPALTSALLSDWRVVVVGGPADQSRAAEIITAAGRSRTRVIDATGRLTPLATAALLGRCSALVTNDSMPQHLASAMGTPTVAIFGPTVPEFGFGPLAPRQAIAGHTGLPCRPCDRHGPRRCPLEHWRCMREISVADVVRLVAHVASAPQLS